MRALPDEAFCFNRSRSTSTVTTRVPGRYYSPRDSRVLYLYKCRIAVEPFRCPSTRPRTPGMRHFGSFDETIRRQTIGFKDNLSKMSIVSSSTFVGEKYLQIKLPDYEFEYLRLTVLIGCVTGLLGFSLLLPQLFATKNQYVVTITTKKIDHQKNDNKALASVKVKNVAIRNVPLYARLISLIGILLSCIIITRLIGSSPNNTFPVRRVFEAPLLTKEECSSIIEMSERAAERNAKVASETLEDFANHWTEYEEEQDYIDSNLLLQQPQGWQKLRHGRNPTTDLNIMDDPYTVEERVWIRNLLDRRLAPTLSRIYGIPATSMRGGDMFVVRYSGGDRVSLAKHQDGGDITVSITLNDAFEGGGTQFWNRQTGKPFGHVKDTAVGSLATFPASILHEGMAITSGKRYLLVAFLDIDRVVDGAESGDYTGISPFASYLNINWIYRRAVDVYDEHMDFITSTFSLATRKTIVSQFFKPVFDYADKADHGVVSLVKDEDYMSYVNALDRAVQNNSTASQPRWFRFEQDANLLQQPTLSAMHARAF